MIESSTNIKTENITTSSRKNKGKNILEIIEDYTALDLETTGLDPCYDSIIEIAAIRV